MHRRLALLVIILAFATPACGDDDGSIFEGTPGTVPESAGTIVVEAGGSPWELPAAACLHAAGDRDLVLAAAQQQAAEVRYLVGDLVSGWPTTTWAQAFDYQAYAEDLHTAGVTALALAALIDQDDALLAAWEEWEQAYASPDEGWGPPDEISGRVEGWRAEAETLTGAIVDHCAA